jgi:hypothetical protein
VALILPSAYSTFGDSSKTEGPTRKYVLAQFRADADLGWVVGLRAALAIDELKYKAVEEARPRLKRDEDLWAAVLAGVSQATIVISDPAPHQESLRQALLADGAKEGTDFGLGELVRGSAHALIAGTPIAFLPNELLKSGAFYGRPVASLLDFSPRWIQDQIGDGLNEAMIFSARAHATFDVATRDRNAVSTRDIFASPMSWLIFREMLATARVFDTENPKTTDLLNRASDEIAGFVLDWIGSTGFSQRRRPGLAAHLVNVSDQPLVSEADSNSIDHLQAADVAAGWARAILDTADMTSIMKLFECVISNGQILRRRDG